MTTLCSVDDFGLILDFAFGMADRGIPLTLVAIGPDRSVDATTRMDLGSTLARATRSTDRIVEVEEGVWIALLVDCNRQGALIYADRIGEGIAALGPVDCGIAAWSEAFDSADDLLEAARAALAVAREREGAHTEIHGE
ncbi:MAG: hypothetical protein RQ745_09805 [Longimicrobiales bacterium]|nr:hypothetical protein [Longimicrobiales bacterium]